MSAQTTLAGAVEVSGVALHGGHPVRARLSPAPADSGIVFESGGVKIPATVDHVVDTQLATTLGLDGAKVRTVEHLLATLLGLGVDNLHIVVEGEELPALDGCGAAWAAHIRGVGLCAQDRPKTLFTLCAPVEYRDGSRLARLEPCSGLSVDLSIDFEHPSVGQQRLSIDLQGGVFERELAWARTFGFEHQVPAMQRMGLVRGGSLDNALVFGETGPLNPGGVRQPDEPVRHKVLDALGDLALLGRPVVGRLVAERPGHGVMVGLMRAVMSQPEAWELHTPKA
jgi:UDP-3-O-[3-hydroxymyristoyl] N-acetylglucosamine deacetylase